jgi:DNA-binding IclR family transcriptional regulator
MMVRSVKESRSKPLIAAIGRREYRVPAAEKALDIIEFMARQGDDVTQTEISLGLGRSIHEVYRIIQLLEKREFLVRTNADRYRLSLKLFELAHMHAPVNRLIDCALPVMRTLVGNIDQSCHLAVLHGLQILIVLQVDSPLPIRFSVALGSQYPLLETSSGIVLLAALSGSARAAIFEQLVAANGKLESRQALEARLRDVAERGHDVSPSVLVEGSSNISLPIRDHMGATVAALTVPYLPHRGARLPPQGVLDAVRTAAEAISRALGAPDSPDGTRPAGGETGDADRPPKPRLVPSARRAKAE